MFDTRLVAGKIKEARIAKDMTQLMLADEMGVSYQAVSNWERGNSMPDIGKIEQLCDVLDLNLEELLGAGKETETVKKVMEESEELSIEEIAEVAAMIPPRKTEEHVTEALSKRREIDISAVAGMAPFLSTEVLDQIAESVSVENIGELPAIAPFVSEEALDRIIAKIPTENLGDAAGLFPFVSDEALNSLAEKMLAEEEGMEKVTMLAPFLDEKILGKMILERLKKS